MMGIGTLLFSGVSSGSHQIHHSMSSPTLLLSDSSVSEIANVFGGIRSKEPDGSVIFNSGVRVDSNSIVFSPKGVKIGTLNANGEINTLFQTIVRPNGTVTSDSDNYSLGSMESNGDTILINNLIIKPNSSVKYPNGVTEYLGDRKLPNGDIVHPNGEVLKTNGDRLETNGDLIHPDGSIEHTDDTIDHPKTDRLLNYSESILHPDGSITDVNGNTTYPNSFVNNAHASDSTRPTTLISMSPTELSSQDNTPAVNITDMSVDQLRTYIKGELSIERRSSSATKSIPDDLTTSLNSGSTHKVLHATGYTTDDVTTFNSTNASTHVQLQLCTDYKGWSDSLHTLDHTFKSQGTTALTDLTVGVFGSTPVHIDETKYSKDIEKLESLASEIYTDYTSKNTQLSDTTSNLSDTDRANLTALESRDQLLYQTVLLNELNIQTHQEAYRNTPQGLKDSIAKLHSEYTAQVEHLQSQLDSFLSSVYLNHPVMMSITLILVSTVSTIVVAVLMITLISATVRASTAPKKTE